MSRNFVRVELMSHIVKSLAEHEVFMSFTDDIGAQAFGVWWEEEGSSRFKRWCEDDEEFNKAVK